MIRIWRLVSRYAIVFTSLAIIAGTVVWIYYRSPRRGLPYHDQFGKGHLSEWQQFGGTWRTAGDTLRNDSDERGAKLIAGSLFWKNYKVEADLQLLGRGDAGIVIRTNDMEEGVDSYRGYYAGLRIDDQTLVLGRADYGWLEFPPVHMPGGVAPNRWYHLTLSAFDCTVQAAAVALDTGESTHTSAFDPKCLRSGKFGLRAVSSGGIWRNVQVQALMSAEGPVPPPQQPTQASLYPTSQGRYPRLYGLLRDTEVLNSSNTPSSDILPISSLRLLAVPRQVRATVRGTVILTTPHVYIQDATAGAEVLFPEDSSVKLGDEVEVTGDAHLEDLSLRIENAIKHTISGVVPVPALSITPLQAAMGRYDGMFVEVEARLDSSSQNGNSMVRLNLSGGQQEFYAISNSLETARQLSELEPGSVLLLRGICLVGSAYTSNKLPFALIIRSPDEVEVLSGPPWWTGEHLAMAALGMLVLGFLIHVLYSHADQRRRSAVLRERERLAHEMHDTLAQSFAGLDFKLRAIRNRTVRDAPNIDAVKVREELQEACELVRHSHDEARRSLASLRPEVLEKRGLPEALTQLGNRMVAGSAMVVKTEVTGQPRQLPVRIVDAIFRIGQEAIANAVQHSHAKHLGIRIDYQSSQLVMVVEDDGHGFRSEQKSEGFGLTGMRRRAQGIKANLDIQGNGTGVKITVAAPCKPEPFWLFSLSYIRGRRYE